MTNTNIEITRNRNMFGRSLPGHVANLGDFNAEGSTATEAKNNLLAKVASFSRTLYVIGTNAGDVFVVTRSLSGQMEYSICGKGRTYGSGCLMSITDAKSAVEAARRHAISSFDGIAWEHSA